MLDDRLVDNFSRLWCAAFTFGTVVGTAYVGANLGYVVFNYNIPLGVMGVLEESEPVANAAITFAYYAAPPLITLKLLERVVSQCCPRPRSVA